MAAVGMVPDAEVRTAHLGMLVILRDTEVNQYREKRSAIGSL
jgi:hypothetical protein